MRLKTRDTNVNRAEVGLQVSKISCGTASEVLRNTTGRQIGATRRLESASTKPTRNVFSDPITESTRSAADVSAAARTFKFIDNATSLTRRFQDGFDQGTHEET